jgi:hypothetical protein
MKMIKNTAVRISLMFLSLLASVLAFAQEKGADINVDINKNNGGGGWYTNPIVWIVGGAIFILLLVALLRGGGNKD